MNIQDLNIPKVDMHKLLAAASGDVALLYLYLKSGNPLQEAGKALRMPESRVSCAVATLGQLGLWSEERPASFVPGERPSYSEKDVLQAMDTDGDFKLLKVYCAARESASFAGGCLQLARQVAAVGEAHELVWWNLL